MKKHRKLKIALLIAVPSVIILLILAYVRWFYLSIEADEKARLDNWELSITYDMLSDKLKSVISEEEFNDRTDRGKYNMYRKLEGLELETRKKYDPSTCWYKTPPTDCIEVDGRIYIIEYRIDFTSDMFSGVKVINFATYIDEIETDK